MAQKHWGQVFTEGAVQRSRLRLPSRDQWRSSRWWPSRADVADVIEDHRLLVRLGPQAAADHLQVQCFALGGAQQDAAAHRGHIHPLADQAAGGEHLQFAAPSCSSNRRRVGPSIEPSMQAAAIPWPLKASATAWAWAIEQQKAIAVRPPRCWR